MKFCKTCARKFAAELFGTFVLTFFGCSAAVISNGLGLGMLGVALAFGLSIVAMAYVIGDVSGCHINPAVTLGCFLTKRIELKQLIGYWIAQFLGGILAAGLLAFILSNLGILQMQGADFHRIGLGANGYGILSATQITALGAFVIEALLTAVFVYTVLGVTDYTEYDTVAGIVIGLTLAFVHIVGIPFTGTSVNPARSFGPALFLGGEALKQVWLFIAAPLCGAVIAAVIYRLVNGLEDECECGCCCAEEISQEELDEIIKEAEAEAAAECACEDKE